MTSTASSEEDEEDEQPNEECKDLFIGSEAFDASSSKSEISHSALLCHQSIEDWEENWLFRRKRPLGLGSMMNGGGGASTSLTMLTDDPVAMLVPLPNEAGDAKALIGEKDADQVSELSERQSVASSLDYFSSSSSTASENDLEHTEYSVTPLIRSSVSISRGSAKEMIRALKQADQAGAGRPIFVTKPGPKVTSEANKVVTFEAVTAGQKPIGKAICKSMHY